jgi:hypothetical protein
MNDKQRTRPAPETGTPDNLRFNNNLNLASRQAWRIRLAAIELQLNGVEDELIRLAADVLGERGWTIILAASLINRARRMLRGAIGRVWFR